MNLPSLGPVIDRVWELRATRDILSADKNTDFKLDKEEYKAVSQIKGDGLFINMARDYEFAVVDEIGVADGKIGLGELASFYKTMDSDKDTSHTQEEFATRLNESSWGTRLKHPVGAFSQTMSYYTGLASKAIGKIF